MTLGLTGAGVDIGITVRDPDRMVPFYRDFLGLPLARHVSWPGSGAQVWFFAVGNGHVKLLAFSDTPGAANPAGGNADATGYRYMAIMVDDVERALVGLDQAGGRIQRPVATHGPSTVVFVEDPEGNCIELVERSEEAG